jgi:hypothetical protein
MNQTVAKVQPLLRRLTCRFGCYRAWRGPQPQRRGSGLHGLVDHGLQLGRQGVQVDLLAEAGAERFDRAGGVVAVAVEASIHNSLDTAAWAGVARSAHRLWVSPKKRGAGGVCAGST